MAEGGRQTNKQVVMGPNDQTNETNNKQIVKNLAQDAREVRPAGVQGVQGDHA